MKRLSIYIPTYNRREFLRKQLDFIFSDAEEYLSEIEVIVSDNASDDGTGELVETLQENYPIVYHRNEKNLGIVANLWPSGRYCTGEFLWIIGDDDTLERGVTGRIFRILNSHPDVNFIYLNYAIMNGLDLKYGYSIPVAPQELCPGYLEDPLPLVMDNLEVMTPPLVLSSAHLMRREIWNEAISVISYTELEGYGINFAAPLAAIKRGKAYFDPEISSYANYMNCSWRAEALRSFYGTQLSVLKLKDLGYTEEEIQKIQKGLLKRNLASLNGLRSNNPDFDQEEILRIENYLLRSVDCPVKKLSRHEVRPVFTNLSFLKGKRVVIYGAGLIGNQLRQACAENGIEVAAWCDRNYRKLREEGKEVNAPEIIKDLDFDLVLDAVAAPSAMEEIFNLLTSLGVDKDRIKLTLPEHRMIIQ